MHWVVNTSELRRTFTPAGRTVYSILEMSRPYTLFWYPLLSLSAFLLSSFDYLAGAILAFLTPLTGWLGGLYLGDYLHRDLDLIEKPHRPIPSGRVSITLAMYLICLSFFLLFLFFLLVAFLPKIMMLFAVLLIFLYNSFGKKMHVCGHLARGLMAPVTFLFGYSIGSSTLDPELFLIFAFLFLHDFTSNVVGAFRDVKGDREGGYITIPVYLGHKKAKGVALLSTSLYLLLFLWYGMNSLTPLFILGFMLCAFFTTRSLFFLKKYERRSNLKAHQQWVLERIILAFTLMAMSSNNILYFIFYSTIFLVTYLSQKKLRLRYEVSV